MADVITARGLEVGYGDVPVLSGMDFDIPAGRVTVIVGRSGCGKSTLLKTLAGLLPPLRGRVVFEGAPVDFRSEAALAGFYARIGVLYQDGALLNNLSLFENVALPIRMRYPQMPEEILREWVEARLESLGLGGSGDREPAELSGGMRKRAALARAIVLDPDVIFCDEPSSGLDPITAGNLDALLLNLKTTFKSTLVIVTHELRSIERLADRALVVGDGRLLAAGDVAALRGAADPVTRSFFPERPERHAP